MIYSPYMKFFGIFLGTLYFVFANGDNLKIFEELKSNTIVNEKFENIQEGKFRFWKTLDCLDILYSSSPFPISEGCYFENPDAPHGLIMLPPHVDELPDKYFGYPISDNNYSATWHMKENDVIILLGIPPFL